MYCTASKYKTDTASPQRACGSIEHPTSLPQSPKSALSSAQCKRQTAALSLCMFKLIAAAWRSMQWHSAYIALLATAQRAPLRSAFFDALVTL